MAEENRERSWRFDKRQKESDEQASGPLSTSVLRYMYRESIVALQWKRVNARKNIQVNK